LNESENSSFSKHRVGNDQHDHRERDMIRTQVLRINPSRLTVATMARCQFAMAFELLLKLLDLITFTVVMLVVAYTVLAERRILGFIQGRLGPNRVGYGGVLQPFADLLKFILKEDIVPDKSTRLLLPGARHRDHDRNDDDDRLSIWTRVNLPFLGPIKLVVARFDVALLYVLGITSIGVYGIALAGWSSNNKYSLMGGLRSSRR